VTFELSLLTKIGGPLTKRVHLDGDHLANDSSACVMSHGRAHRFTFDTPQQLTDLISGLKQNQAIALGALPEGGPDEFEVTTKRRLNGSAPPGLIARTAEYFTYRLGMPAWALIDFDKKGMPEEMERRLDAAGGLWSVLPTIVPELAQTARVIRPSTSAGLYRVDTGERLCGSGGLHIYVAVQDGRDIERFLKVLHERCWLAGFGWMMVGTGGQLLERSIVDRVVGGPERLSFEGPAELIWPVEQDAAARRPLATEGEALDTNTACSPLTILEMSRLRESRTKEAARLAPASAKAREVFVDEQSKKLVERTKMEPSLARRTIERQCEGILLPDLVLPLNRCAGRGCGVAPGYGSAQRHHRQLPCGGAANAGFYGLPDRDPVPSDQQPAYSDGLRLEQRRHR
jgi:hypothetical protein